MRNGWDIYEWFSLAAHKRTYSSNLHIAAKWNMSVHKSQKNDISLWLWHKSKKSQPKTYVNRKWHMSRLMSIFIDIFHMKDLWNMSKKFDISPCRISIGQELSHFSMDWAEITLHAITCRFSTFWSEIFIDDFTWRGSSFFFKSQFLEAHGKI